MRIGIDLGGTKIEGVLLDASGSVVTRQRIGTPKNDYDGTIAAVIASFNTWSAKAATSRHLWAWESRAVSWPRLVW